MPEIIYEILGCRNEAPQCLPSFNLWRVVDGAPHGLILTTPSCAMAVIAARALAEEGGAVSPLIVLRVGKGEGGALEWSATAYPVTGAPFLAESTPQEAAAARKAAAEIARGIGGTLADLTLYPGTQDHEEDWNEYAPRALRPRVEIIPARAPAGGMVFLLSRSDRPGAHVGRVHTMRDAMQAADDLAEAEGLTATPLVTIEAEPDGGASAVVNAFGFEGGRFAVPIGQRDRAAAEIIAQSLALELDANLADLRPPPGAAIYGGRA